jgi:hypothetical protein
VLSGNYLNDDNNDGEQEHQQADAVNAMHVAHPPAFWRIRILFFEVEVFCDLLPYTHKQSFIATNINQEQKALQKCLTGSKFLYICSPVERGKVGGER